MIVSGWNNSSPNNRTGARYGIRISKKDRDKYFCREWNFVEIELESDEIVEVRHYPILSGKDVLSSEAQK